MRVAVLAPARLNDFHHEVLRRLLESDRVEVVAACVDARPPASRLTTLRRNLERGRGGYVLVLAARALARRGDPGPRSAAFFSERAVPVLDTPDLYTPETVAFLESAKPACLLRLGFGIVREPILSLAPGGTLSYHHGNPRRYRGQPAGFWEIYNGEPETGAIVQVLGDEIDAGAIVCERTFPVLPGESWAELRRRTHDESADMALEACLRLEDPAFEPIRLAPTELGPVYTTPNLRQWLRMQLRVIGP